MKTVNAIIIALALSACVTQNPIDSPKTQEELDLWIQAEEFVRYEENKAKTLWMYSAGSFALLAIGLGILAFSPVRRTAGFVFILGGAVGMASTWVFESDWFPWVAGATFGLILISLLSFAWVKLYRYLFSSRT